MILNHAGHHAEQAASGEHALDALRATVTPDAGTTELYDSQPGWHVRSTSTSGGGNVTLSGTSSAAGTAAWALLEVLAA